MPRSFWLLLAVCFVASPNAAMADGRLAERYQWFSAPGDVRSAYLALRNMPAFIATIPRLFVGESNDPPPEADWRSTFTSSDFRWTRIAVQAGGPPIVILVLSAPGRSCPEDGCPGFVMAQDETSDTWRIACELKTFDWSRPRRLRRQSHGWHWFTAGDLTVGWRRGTPGQGWLGGPVCYRAGPARPPDFSYMGSLLHADYELHAFTATESPHAAVLRGMTAEDIGRPRGPTDWRRRFDPLLHLRWMRVQLETTMPGAVALMLASPLLCRDGRCPVAIVSEPTNVVPRTTLCTLDVPWESDVVRLPGRDHGIGRLAMGDRLVGRREAPENARGLACTVSDLPPPR